ncbi:hypothetical protein ACFSBZ_15815 [Amnibacterium flavum]|uniref:DUF2076 domain-containing protein n=1 Tax=Amnibacterium flavum TaxID=2173173 RepID=A0A2V1HXU0_9MICO|nr:hypothetical protein [Amnibacterium flavum]PVZ96170.1 hypothetical protein DDQ50_07005 [Amnibacterium flavum]
MGFLDRLLGREDDSADQRPARPQTQPRTDDEIAIERYRYLLRTAPPETIEQVHAEAFSKLTPEQRRQVYDELKQGSEPPVDDQPASLARSATRAEIRDPGSMERTFGGNAARGGPSFGSMVGSSILGTVAGYVIGSALVSAFMPDAGYGDASADGGDSGDTGADSGDAGSDAGGDSGGWGDSGWGGDSGGGDFGGGDFGGGDFGGFDV